MSAKPRPQTARPANDEATIAIPLDRDRTVIMRVHTLVESPAPDAADDIQREPTMTEWLQSIAILQTTNPGRVLRPV